MRYERRAHRTVYENPWIRFEAHEIAHPNGRPGEHGLVVGPEASAVVVYDAGNVFLTRQARFAADEVVLEVVKGGRAPGETPLEGAQRETREELGFIAQRWDALGVGYELPSIVSPAVNLFLARVLTRGATELEHVESIDTVCMPLRDAIAAVLDGAIDDAITALALFRAKRIIDADAS